MRRENVSVVILTFNRPDLVCRAVRSALGQTHPPAEIVIIVDGPDECASLSVLRAIDDPRLRLVQLENNVGVSSARNAGIAHARHDWVAFLDDDDEWMPSKLERQLNVAKSSTLQWPIIASPGIIRTGRVDLIWPRRLPRAGEPICDYLFRRSLPISGEGAMLSSTLLAPRELLLRVRFADGLRRLDDIDWLLRVTREPDVGVMFTDVSEPLAICHTDMGRYHASTAGVWRESVTWAQARRHLLTRQAYAGFMCANVSDRASRCGEPGVFSELLSEARRNGQPSWVDLTSHVMNFALTRRRRDFVLNYLKKLGLMRS